MVGGSRLEFRNRRVDIDRGRKKKKNKPKNKHPRDGYGFL